MIISGKEISTKIKDQLKEEVEQMKNKYDRLPKLAVILVGENTDVTYFENTDGILASNKNVAILTKYADC